MSIDVRRKRISHWTDRFLWTANFSIIHRWYLTTGKEFFSILSSRLRLLLLDELHKARSTHIDHLSDRSDTETFFLHSSCNSLSNWLNLVGSGREKKIRRVGKLFLASDDNDDIPSYQDKVVVERVPLPRAISSVFLELDLMGILRSIDKAIDFV